MKIGVSSYSYETYLSSGKMDLTEVIASAAQAGFDGIELANTKFPDGLDRASYAARIKEICDKSGMNICAYSIAGDFFQVDLPAEIERLKADIGIARILGAPIMRTDIMDGFGSTGMSFDQCIKRVIPGLRELADVASSQGIILTTENHGRLFCESDRLEQLISQVDHDHFRILADLGNFVDADEDCAYAVGRLAPWISHVHIKDFHIKPGDTIYPGEGWYLTRGGHYLRGAIIGHGNVPLLPCLKALVGANYQGWLAVEFEGLEDAELGVRLGLAHTRRLIQSLPLFQWQEGYT